MAKKRKSTSKPKKSSKSSQNSSGKTEGNTRAGPRVMEKTMSEIGRLLQEQEFASHEDANAFIQEQLQGKPVDVFSNEAEWDPLRRAQELIYDAWEMLYKSDRVRLAERALVISPDCADAYNLLAEEKAKSAAEARAYYEEGVRAGERALGPEAFKEDVGYFWGLMETRPYMRARAGLAECLWILGEREAAVEHYRDMLRLNPGDNQGIRYVLLGRLLEMGEEERVGKLLKEYEGDGSASWLYNRALWLYRRTGESGAEAALTEALEQNPHVPVYLLGRKRVPKRLPEYIGWGDESEAKAYASDAIELWKATDGARGWLLRTQQTFALR
ncbi:MAG TPA: hypothetical protein VFI91_03165 [Longimicrobiaceae bacterium]|nr:hypothetical protein [Longimicrobiaceae bacterium]